MVLPGNEFELGIGLQFLNVGFDDRFLVAQFADERALVRDRAVDRFFKMFGRRGGLRGADARRHEGTRYGREDTLK
jgi:hypothetical protein